MRGGEVAGNGHSRRRNWQIQGPSGERTVTGVWTDVVIGYLNDSGVMCIAYAHYPVFYIISH